MLPVALLLAVGCRTPEPASEPAPSPAATGGVEAAVARALPAVVLVVAGPPGAQTYGAGVLMDGQGHAVTNLHVVESAPPLRVLLHDPARVIWSPLDGGLDRLLFEADADLVDGEVLRTDPILDLAMLHVPAAAGRAALDTRAAPPAAGEPVLALGHPQQAAWSFTSGVVSAVRPGMVQHDAPINPGNSGGPLVDLDGRLLGINTSKLLGGAEGVGFARPIELTQPLLDPAHRPLTPDLSTPEAASIACERILELAPEQSAPCVQWSDSQALVLLAAERAADILVLDEAQRAVLRQSIQAVPPAEHARVLRDAAVAGWLGREPEQVPWTLGLPELWATSAERDAHDARHGARDRLRAAGETYQGRMGGRSERLRAENNLHEDIGTGGEAYARTRKRGKRVESIRYVNEGVAWLAIAGRNADGSVWRTSGCWMRGDDGLWRRSLACSLLYEAPRPADLPPGIFTEADRHEAWALQLAMALLGDEGDLVIPD